MWKLAFVLFVVLDGVPSDAYKYLNTRLNITDCYFINNNTESMGLVCHDSTYVYPKSDTCFESFFREKFEVKLPKLKLLKIQNRCGLELINDNNGYPYHQLDENQNWRFGYFKPMLSQISDLLEIDASFNRVAALNAISFENFPNLTTILLSDNVISEVKVGTFDRLSKLKHLDLSNNFISIIHDDLFLKNKNLNLLQLENNPIKRLNSGIYSAFRNVPSVNIQLNEITEIEISYQTKSKYRLLLGVGGEKGIVIELLPNFVMPRMT